MQPAKPQAGEIDRHVADLWKAFDAIGRVDQLRFIHDACLRLGLDPLKMASPAAFRLADEEPELDAELPAEVAPATDDAAEDSQAEQRVDAADFGAEDLQVADVDASEDADQEPGGAMKCACCNMGFESGDQPQMIDGPPYHRVCALLAKSPLMTAE